MIAPRCSSSMGAGIGLTESGDAVSFAEMLVHKARSKLSSITRARELRVFIGTESSVGREHWRTWLDASGGVAQSLRTSGRIAVAMITIFLSFTLAHADSRADSKPSRMPHLLSRRGD
jgi:hypothetical protein